MSISKHSSKAVIIAALKALMQAKGFRSVPLTNRVEYSYFDDHEDNDGEISWLVINDMGEINGLDEDMEIRLTHFTKAELLEMETQLDWNRGLTTERTHE